jgi:hypothetical protein
LLFVLLGWRGNCNPGESSHEGAACWHVGMREITVDSYKGGPSGTVSLKKCGTKFCDTMYDAGTIIMATGIIAFVTFIVAVVLLCVAHRKGLPSYRYGALALLYITSALMTLGSVLYAEKAAAGYSFILMIIAGFFYFCGSFRAAQSQTRGSRDSTPMHGHNAVRSSPRLCGTVAHKDLLLLLLLLLSQVWVWFWAAAGRSA